MRNLAPIRRCMGHEMSPDVTRLDSRAFQRRRRVARWRVPGTEESSTMHIFLASGAAGFVPIKGSRARILVVCPNGARPSPHKRVQSTRRGEEGNRPGNAVARDPGVVRWGVV